MVGVIKGTAIVDERSAAYAVDITTQNNIHEDKYMYRSSLWSNFHPNDCKMFHNNYISFKLKDKILFLLCLRRGVIVKQFLWHINFEKRLIIRYDMNNANQNCFENIVNKSFELFIIFGAFVRKIIGEKR
jgi:hypothetical protein